MSSDVKKVKVFVKLEMSTSCLSPKKVVPHKPGSIKSTFTTWAKKLVIFLIVQDLGSRKSDENTLVLGFAFECG